MAPAGLINFLRLVSLFSNRVLRSSSSFEYRSSLKITPNSKLKQSVPQSIMQKIFPPLPGAEQEMTNKHRYLKSTKPGRHTNTLLPNTATTTTTQTATRLLWSPHT